jgi:hypothetical protein
MPAGTTPQHRVHHTKVKGLHPAAHMPQRISSAISCSFTLHCTSLLIPCSEHCCLAGSTKTGYERALICRCECMVEATP